MNSPPAMAQEASDDAGEAGIYRVTDHPMHYFAAVQRQHQLNLAHALRPLGLTPQSWRVLAALSDGAARSIGQISELVVIDRANLGRLLESMAKDALVDRSAAADRRSTLIRQTPAGQSSYAAALPLVHAVNRQLLAGFSAPEKEALLRMLRRMKRNAFGIADALGAP